MGGSTAETPTAPDDQPAHGLRASDAERDQVVARLRDEFVAGRLSHDTFLHRVDLVLGSRRQADLPPAVADLPPPRSRADRLRGALARVVPARGLLPAGGLFSRASPAESRDAPGPARLIPRGPRWAPTTGMASLPGDGPLPALPFPRGDGRSFSIGRDADCDLTVGDLTVSRRHAELERTSDGWLLTDLRSTNGTRVNGWRVRGQDRVPVRPGDRVSFGDLEVYFISDPADRNRRS
jgi:hypothetical protein